MIEPSVDQLWRRAQEFMSSGNLIAAKSLLQALLSREPGHSAAHMTLGHISWSEGRVRESAYHTLQVADDPPASAEAIISISMALLRVGEITSARACLRHPALIACKNARVLMLHAGLCRQLGEDEKALQLFEDAKAVGADGAEFRFARGMELLICGRLAEGERDLESSLRMDPSAGAAALELSRLRKQTTERNHLADFDARLRRMTHDTQDYAALQFARYKVLEDLGRNAEAWEALLSANGTMRALHPCDPREMERLVDCLAGFCTPTFLQRDRKFHSGPQPIFIFGLPRSGTTLLDRLLGSHSQVASAGELDDFSRQLCWSADHRVVLDAEMQDALPHLDYAELGARYLAHAQWRAGEKPLFIDKQPWNHVVAGLIGKALPGARLLHMVRDPMDVCFSNFRAMLGARYSYSFDLDTLGRHYLQYRRLHTHWQAVMPERVLDVTYADLVHRTEPTLRKVLAFCGLDWEPACLDGARNPATVGSLSAVQVRAPIHHRAFGEWRAYEGALAGLRATLEGLDALNTRS